MPLFVKHRSFTEKVLLSRKRRKILGKILLVILCISVTRAFFLQSYGVSSTLMEPGLVPGDVVVSFPLPLGASTLFGKLPPVDTPKRGELVLVKPDALPLQSGWFGAWDTIVRFFTLQRVSPLALRYGERLALPGIYRIVGLPGDTIRRKAELFEIRPEGKREFSSEYALSRFSYRIRANPSSSARPLLPDRQAPAETSLGEGEYFVACDDRTVFSGSLLWGPIGINRIVGRIVIVAWPPKHMGIP